MMVSLGNTMGKDAINLLNLDSTDQVMEIGFGPGIGLQVLADAVSDGTVTGIDPSNLMHKLATSRNKKAIDNDLISLFKGTVAKISFNNHTFNGVLEMDNMHFWDDPLSGLNEIYRVLIPGSKFVCSFTFYSRGCKNGWKVLFIKADFVDFNISEQ